jgi:hypothetical protein
MKPSHRFCDISLPHNHKTKKLADHDMSQPDQHTQLHGGGEGMIDMITGALEGGNHQKSRQTQTDSGAGRLIEKISGAVQGHRKPAQNGGEGLIGRISGAIEGHQKLAQQHAGGGGIMSHIKNALGGGEAGEKKEGE